MSEKQVGIRPRVLTVERRNPGRRALRVLKRLTWTETDGFAQHEKLRAAYAVTDWAEEHFNNRALFSDYYLLERLLTHCHSDALDCRMRRADTQPDPGRS